MNRSRPAGRCPRARRRAAALVALLLALGAATAARAETGYDLWLRYQPLRDPAQLRAYRASIAALVVEGGSPAATATLAELVRGLGGLLGRPVPVTRSVGPGAVVVGTPATSPAIARLGWARELDALGAEGYVIRTVPVEGGTAIAIASAGEAGALHGTFHFLRLLQTGAPIGALDVADRPRIERRILDHWDNLDGSIERGYAGASIWGWDDLPGRVDPRITDYARANASIGINGVVLNNVNADPRVLRADYLRRVAAIADVLRPYGIRVYLSANFAAPLPPSATPERMKRWGGIGGLPTADPLDPRVQRWWEGKVEEIYALVPDFGGFLVKANSEGMPGPKEYGRSHAEGANLLARALAPHGGIVMWRAFVYDGKSEPDRAKRAYQEFVPLDGRFLPNVAVQIKNGPLDFQPYEPFHPLFGAMPRTGLVAELQITQEYLGHATHLVYLAPMWRAFLDSDTRAHGPGSTVARLLEGPVEGRGISGIAGVANVGSDRNWTGHPFAQANWYAFGRLAWDPALTAERIAGEWARMTWGPDPVVDSVVTAMMLGSWSAAVDYMTPLGLSYTIGGGDHYDPAPASREGTFWSSGRDGLGYDRSARGSDFVAQYPEPLRARWNDPRTTPLEELLWFHHLAWDYPLPTGRTLWEELAYRYYRGARYADFLDEAWLTIRDRVDAERWGVVKARLEEQRAHARLWRDTVVGYFQERSGLPIPAEARALAAPER